MLNWFKSILYSQLSRPLRGKMPRIWYYLPLFLLVTGLRETDTIQQWNLLALDRLLSMRPIEAIDNRIVLIGIDEADLQQESDSNSISDQKLADIINLVAAANPRVIGVDIIRDKRIDLPLQDTYQKHKNVIGLAKRFPPDPLEGPPGLDLDRVGFGDYEPDFDSLVRRAILADFNGEESLNRIPKYSFAFQISRLYLQQQNKKIQISSKQLELGEHKFLPLQSIDNNHHTRFDILVNYRHIHPTFSQFNLTDITTQKALDFRNKIVIIGYTASTKQDFVNTSIFSSSISKIDGNIFGIEYHAHIVSQLVTTAFNERSFIQSLPFWGDYLWILTCIICSGFIFRMVKLKAPFWQTLGIISIYIFGVFISVYLLFLVGWLAPIGLTLIVLTLSFPILLSYQREQSLIAITEKRRQAIIETFNAIHNGPLQELSLLLQAVKSEKISLTEISDRLEQLNQQIRHIGESLQETTTTSTEMHEVVLGTGDRLDLNTPLNELFYLVSDRTLHNDSYPNLINLKVKVINFQEVPAESQLTIEQKRQLCQFLEEAIGNVGKYAEGATKLQLLGIVDGNLYRLTIEDDGRGRISSRVGDGTKQAKHLASHLKGKFTRSQNMSSNGVNCSIEWNFYRKF